MYCQHTKSLCDMLCLSPSFHEVLLCFFHEFKPDFNLLRFALQQKDGRLQKHAL